MLTNGNLNKYWNVIYFYYKSVSIQQCNKYKDYYVSINQVPHVFKTEQEVISFVDSI